MVSVYFTELRPTDACTDVTSTLTTLMIDGISSHAMLLDSFVVLHAAFISSLHRLIGVEFGTNSHCRNIHVLSLTFQSLLSSRTSYQLTNVIFEITKVTFPTSPLEPERGGKNAPTSSSSYQSCTISK